MPLSLNEIKDRALAFSREWTGERSEKAEAQTFWNEFFNVFGVSRRRIASFEEPVRRARTKFEAKGGRGGFIDLFWRGMLIAEHKSLGRDLDSAYKQALEYFDGLAERDLPRYIIVSDFARIRLYDLDSGTQDEFPLKDLYRNVRLFGFIAGYTTQRITAQDPVNIKAAERMGKLHDRLRSAGYTGHALEVLLVRLLFCLFAEDTSLFEPRGSFRDFLENSTREDGSDLGPRLMHLFQVLNTPENSRQSNLDEALAAFPYVNGKLFEEALPIPACDSAMRDLLLDCCALDWGKISPAIFGALFQCVMDEEGSARRRNLGAHYTSEENILKLINPLFLDGLRAEFDSAKRSANKLFTLLKKISGLKLLDPACGCGNFLVIAYRELRELELEILRAARATGQRHLDIFQLVQVNVNQFHGIEIEEFPAQIAQVALWLTDHQMNMKVSEEFGQYFRRLPLIDSAEIRCGNALRMDWNEVISAEQVDYILGNPPFVGKKEQSNEQKSDMSLVFSGIKGTGVLDYVSAWYLKAVKYIRGDEKTNDTLESIAGAHKPPRDRVKAAFVSTNSITQGEQVGVLWTELLRLGVKIHFAHRTFQWSNEARGKAAVHCVIIGFALHDTYHKVIYDYESIRGDAHALEAKNINPYIVDAPDMVLPSRRSPICNVPEIMEGSALIDDGHFLLSEKDRDSLLKQYPFISQWIRPFVWGDGFINNEKRFCFWLNDADVTLLRSVKPVIERIEAVKEFRTASNRPATKALALTPTLFGEIRQPTKKYIFLPKTSSERRAYIPIGFLSPSNVLNNTSLAIEGGTLFHFGVLSSVMHMAWMRYVAGRLKNDYRYSGQIVYNNFPWPDAPAEKQKAAIEAAAQGVLDARAAHPEASLADLYDPIAMPPDLRRAHQALDRAVDAAYGKKGFSSDAERVAFLFELYHKYTSLFPAPAKPKKRKKLTPSFA
ncbi:MAG: class I SAM-dependent DNA methyltransferase [Deltaproteobacteria bacterium]|nr:class I SAM-dependent DNA methyltransferase [Deltaproteobacteria bacterium]MBZ0219819.1 N-6 DNA methylase [Deltaproteobacteria bacterium]